MDNNKAGKKSVARQFFKLMFLSGAIFIATLMIIILLIAWFQRDLILDQFSHHLQHHLNVDLQVESLSFGIVRSFPTATVTAQGVKLQSGKKGDPVFVDANAESVQFRINIPDILRKEYRVNRLIIKNGHIITSIDPVHFDLRRPDNMKTENPKLKFDLSYVHLYHVELNYIDPQNAQSHHLLIQKMLLRGSFSETPEWEIDKSSLVFKDHLFETSGTFVFDDEMVWIDAELSGDNFRIESVLVHLPEDCRKALTPFSPKGNLTFTSFFKGRFTSGHIPLIMVEFDVNQGSITHPDKSKKLDQISLKGHYTNGDNQTAASSYIRLHEVRAHTASGQITGTANIQNLLKPELEIDMIADVSVRDLISWTNSGDLEATNGLVKAELFFSGRMNSNRNFSGNELSDADIRGDVFFRDLSFSTNNSQLDYHKFTGKFSLAEDQLLVIRELSGKAGQSDIQLSGTVYNLLPYLFVSDETLYVEAKLISENILLDELLAQNNQSTDHGAYSLSFPQHLHLSLNADVKKLSFRRFTANSIKIQTALINKQLLTEKLTFNTMEGSVTMSGSIDASHGGDIQLNTQAHLQDVDIHRLFYQTGNFGQSSIIDENLYGRVTADIDFFSSWSPELQIRWNSMVTSTSLTIDDGRLVNYQPMQALGRFIRAGNLNDVAFSTLKNEIYIHHEQVLIPMMEINSNVLDIELSGAHSFDNKIDYRLRVELSELLANRHRESRNPQEQFGEIIDDGLGHTTLYLKLTGTSKDVVVRYDQEGVKEKLRADFQEERENLRNIFRNEFSFLSRRPADTIAVKNDRQKEMEQIIKQEEEGFVIEWD